MKKIVFIADAWGYTKGGINSFNYDLCVALGKYSDENYKIYCAVPTAEKAEINSAKQNKVNLISLDSSEFPFSRSVVDYKKAFVDIKRLARTLIKKIKSPKDEIYFIGHDIVTGFIAVESKRNSTKGGTCVIFHHMAYRDYESYKINILQTKINDKVDLQKDLFRSKEVDIAVGVGPKLYSSIQRLNGRIRKRIMLIPGLQEIENLSDNIIEGAFNVITFGRFDSDDIKNMSLAVEAFKLLRENHWKDLSIGQDATITVMGLTDVDEETKHLRESLNQQIKTNIVGLQYKTSRDDLFQELIGNHACLMLSIHEGFGLVGLEAIAAGIPLILTTNSGLYDYLEDTIKPSKFRDIFRTGITLSGNQTEDALNIKEILLKISNDKSNYKQKANALREYLLQSGLNNTEGLTWQNVIKEFLKELKSEQGDIKKGPVINPREISNTQKFPNNIDESLINASSSFFESQNKYLESATNSLKETHKVCLEGIPGAGKTYIAKKIARDSLTKYDIVWWIDADDKKIVSELIQFAYNSTIFSDQETKDFSAKKLPDSDIIKELLVKLKISKQNWLLIYDNAKDTGSVEELDDYINNYIPKIKPNCHLLLTSRNKKWSRTKREITPLIVDLWTTFDVIKYLKEITNGFRIKVDESAIIRQLEIFGKQGKLPLEISIVKKHILKSRDTFTNFYNKWIEKESKLKSDFLNRSTYYRDKNADASLSLPTTVQISYDTLTVSQKEVINLLACFAPDEVPIKTLFHNYFSIFNSQAIATYSAFREHVIELDDLSLCTFNGETPESDESSSMHRLIQDCIKQFQGEEHLMKNHKIVIYLLVKSFDGKNKISLISHVDTVADVILANDQYINLIGVMEESEKREALDLFVKAGQYHFETGDIKSAENQYKSALKIAVDMQLEGSISESEVILLKKILANILFLKGRISENEVTDLTNEISEYYERNEDILSLVAYKNDVINKIFQRQCQFNECQVTLEEIENIVITHNLSIEGALYEYMVQLYVDNDTNKLAEKLSGIYHNLGSLYWTWGRPGDYEKSAEYFGKAIDFQAKFASALEDRILVTNDTDVKDRLQKALNTKKLYLNVSRMIYGAVLGLLEKFTEQWDVHKEAFTYFNSKIASEKRRYAYTAYYMLSYSWDRESLGKGLPEDFDAEQLIKDIYRFDGVLVGYDEKYDVIKKIVRLRIASKNLNSLEPDDLYAEATKAHEELWKQLEVMKYDKRYYDVDTCSVSAFLDYAQYLKGVDKDKARLIVKQARAIIDGIVYPRRPELEELAKELSL